MSGSRFCPVGIVHEELNGSTMFVFLDHQRHWIQVSSALAELLGYSPEELVGKTAAELLPPGVKDRPNLFLQLLQEHSLEAELLLCNRNGQAIAIQTKARVLGDGCILAVITPLEELKDYAA
jgi:PAS domain S-box-containing protein